MGIFNKKSGSTQKTQQKSRVEIAAHKNATIEAVEAAREANQKLNELLVENGFTLKIYLAAGGKTKK